MSRCLSFGLIGLEARAIKFQATRSLLHTTAAQSFQKQFRRDEKPHWKQRDIGKPGRTEKGYGNRPTSRSRLADDLKPSYKKFDRVERPSRKAGDGRSYEPRRGDSSSGKEGLGVRQFEQKHFSDTKFRGKASATSPKGAAEKDSVEALLDEEFDRSSQASSSSQALNLPTSFASPPLIPGLAQSIIDFLGRDSKPTAIQALSIQELLSSSSDTSSWRQTLLASETGSGKSFAYLLPLIQYLKQTEDVFVDKSSKKLPLNPRALVLAPTHELTRQLSAFAKALVHNAKLRVLCTSRANVPNKSDVVGPGVGGATARQMKRSMEALSSELGEDATESSPGLEIGVHGSSASHRPVDILVATPVKALELVRGWGWDKVNTDTNRAFTPSKPEMGLENIEYVVVDEADVLYDPDFQETTLTLLSAISEARSHPLPLPSPLPYLPSSSSPSSGGAPTPLAYPFHLTLTSATIPASLSAFLSTFHPSLTRLVSPGVHRLPATLRTQHVDARSSSGNRFADVEARIKEVWREDALRAQFSASASSSRSLEESFIEDQSERKMKNKLDDSDYRSKILVFCNRRTRVEELGKYLRAKGVENVALTGGSNSSSDGVVARAHGSNKHLAGFLKPIVTVSSKGSTGDQTKAKKSDFSKKSSDDPRVLITTSLLSRGLDFAPFVRTVFLVDPPRNMLDFLHRAGRSGRAGEWGKVVVFGGTGRRKVKAGREFRGRVEALKG